MGVYASHLAGRSYGRLGIALADPPQITIHGFETSHGLHRAVGRTMTTMDRMLVVREPLVVLSQRDGAQFLFLSARGAVVLTTAGMLVTCYGTSDFDEKIRALVVEAGGQ
jgi:hypothetical protein